MNIDDSLRLHQLYDEHQRRCWSLYPAYMHLRATRPDIDLIEETDAGSVSLYHRQRRGKGQEIELYTTPMPCTPEALQHAVKRVQETNGQSRVRIRYVEESDMAEVARVGFTLTARDEEYIIDGEKLRDLAGSEFRRVRREISKTSAHPDLVCRDYRAEDEEGCLAVLARWRDRLKAAGLPVRGNRVTKDCLQLASTMPPEAIKGRVCEVAGEIRAFAFSGPITRDYINLFVAITDTEFRGLAYLIRRDQIMQWPEARFFNHGGDGNRAGLGAFKEAFRPIHSAPIYRAVFS